MRRRRRLGWLAPRHRRGWLWVALTVGIVLNGVRLRQRLSGLRRLDPSPAGPGNESGREAGSAAAADDFVVFQAAGVAVSDHLRRAAGGYARSEGLDVLDLVPADLPAVEALELARVVDTTTYRSDPLAAGRGAGHAVLVRRPVAERAEATAPADRAGFVGVTERLKQHAARTTDVVVAPGLRAVAADPDQRLGELAALYGGALPLALAIPAVRAALLLGGLVLSPGWGAAALVASVFQPYLATVGTALEAASPRPIDAARGQILAPFLVLGSAVTARASGAGVDAGAGEDPVEARRAGYAHDLAGGVERFLEPRRPTCPWCGSTALGERLRTPDLIQFKPGEFVVDECRACGLVFQNPRLTTDGLDFYYRDAYDGLGAESVQFLFAQGRASYEDRVRLVERHGSPRTWLDVGSGYGHFCLIARDLLPDTQFDGLDMGASIDAAERRGWIDRAYRGFFPDLVEELKGRYDVVSMHHYLEHTRDPRAEVAAAQAVLEPGGLLLVEVPDPESGFGRLFGRYWIPWLQPQHQCFLKVDHLVAALGEQGFAVVEIERGPAHQAMDVGGAIWQFGTALAGPGRVPWREPRTTGKQVRRAAALAVTAPCAVLGLAVDRALKPVIKTRGPGWSNTYRVLARRL